ncbi:MAG TPA: signal peptidase I [Nonomuraea sp.]|nr:signal peptidase I [Nonomuraea sp.]
MSAARRIPGLLLAGFVLLVAVLVMGMHAAPLVGHRLLAVRSASMAPAMPVGSLVILSSPPAEALALGDVVTLRLPSGTYVTHRITRLAPRPDGLFVEMKGDANATPDPVLVDAAMIVGRVDLVVPGAGYLLALVTTPSGMVALLAFAAALLVARRLTEPATPVARRRRRLPGTVGPGSAAAAPRGT